MEDTKQTVVFPRLSRRSDDIQSLELVFGVGEATYTSYLRIPWLFPIKSYFQHSLAAALQLICPSHASIPLYYGLFSNFSSMLVSASGIFGLTPHFVFSNVRIDN